MKRTHRRFLKLLHDILRILIVIAAEFLHFAVEMIDVHIQVGQSEFFLQFQFFHLAI